MNRRKFLLTSGGITVGGGIGINILSKSTIATSFKINNEQKLPENWTNPQIKLKFDAFKIETQNIDTSKKLKIEILSGLEENNLKSVTEDKIEIKLDGENYIENKISAVDLTNNNAVKIDDSLESGQSLEIYVRLKLEIDGVKHTTDTTSIPIQIIKPNLSTPTDTVIHYPFQNRSDDNIEEMINYYSDSDAKSHNSRIVEGNYELDNAEKGDEDSNAYIESDAIKKWFNDNIVNEATMIFTYQYDDGPRTNYMWGCRWNRSERRRAQLGVGQWFAPEDRLMWAIRNGDSSGNRELGYYVEDFNINDGNKHRIVLTWNNIDSNGNSGCEVWIDNQKMNLSFERSSSGIGSFSEADMPFWIHHMNDEIDDVNSWSESIIDNMIYCSKVLSEEEIRKDYYNQPWVTVLDDFTKDTSHKYNNIGHGDIILDIDTTDTDSPIGEGVALINSESTNDDCAVSDNENIFEIHPQSGDTLSWLVKTQNTTPGIATYVKTDTNSWTGYAYYVDQDSKLRIRKYTNHGPNDSAGDTLINADININTDEWYLVEAKYPDLDTGEHKMTLFEFDTDTLSKKDKIKSISATDTEHLTENTEGVIGFSNIRDSDSPGKIDWLQVIN